MADELICHHGADVIGMAAKVERAEPCRQGKEHEEEAGQAVAAVEAAGSPAPEQEEDAGDNGEGNAQRALGERGGGHEKPAAGQPEGREALYPSAIQAGHAQRHESGEEQIRAGAGGRTADEDAGQGHKAGSEGHAAVEAGTAGQSPDGADEQRMGNGNGKEQRHRHGNREARYLGEGVHEPEVQRRLVRIGRAVQREHEPVAALHAREDIGKAGFAGEPEFAHLPDFEEAHGRGEEEQDGQADVGKAVEQLFRRPGRDGGRSGLFRHGHGFGDIGRSRHDERRIGIFPCLFFGLFRVRILSVFLAFRRGGVSVYAVFLCRSFGIIGAIIGRRFGRYGFGSAFRGAVHSLDSVFFREGGRVFFLEFVAFYGFVHFMLRLSK